MFRLKVMLALFLFTLPKTEVHLLDLYMTKRQSNDYSFSVQDGTSASGDSLVVINNPVKPAQMYYGRFVGWCSKILLITPLV